MPKATLTQWRRATGSSPTRNTLLLERPDVDGVKTGHTTDAGYVLVASAKRDGVPLLAAVLGAPSEADRDAETEQLLDYGYSLYDREAAVDRGGEEASAGVRYEDEPLLAGRRSRASRSRSATTSGSGSMPRRRPRSRDRSPPASGSVGRRSPSTAASSAACRWSRPARSRRRPIVDRIGGPLVVGLIVLRRDRHTFRGRDRAAPPRQGRRRGRSEAEERMRRREERRRNGGGAHDPHGDAEHRAGPDGRGAADRARQPPSRGRCRAGPRAARASTSPVP